MSIKEGIGKCKSAADYSYSQTKQRMNGSGYNLPKIFLIFLTVLQICGSTMTSGISWINPNPSISRGWEFNWDFHTYVDLENDRIIYERNNTFYYNSENEVVCFTATAEPGLVLTNTTKQECDSEDFDLNPKGTEFGTDNCATHHICHDKSLFVGEIRPISNIGVKGISGCAEKNKGLGQ